MYGVKYVYCIKCAYKELYMREQVGYVVVLSHLRQCVSCFDIVLDSTSYISLFKCYSKMRERLREIERENIPINLLTIYHMNLDEI